MSKTVDVHLLENPASNQRGLDRPCRSDSVWQLRRTTSLASLAGYDQDDEYMLHMRFGDQQGFYTRRLAGLPVGMEVIVFHYHEPDLFRFGYAYKKIARARRSPDLKAS